MVLSATQQQAVKNHLEVVVTSPVFSNSARRAQLLRYLVEKALAGEEGQLTEYAIGVEVLGRPKTFDERHPEPQILYLKVAPDFTEERSDPRYVALERRVGLEP
jgi:hypothetical protein